MIDVDRFIAANAPSWERLAHLTRRARHSAARLSAAELDELVRLYQRTSSHLSHARTYYGEAALIARLTGLVASAGGVIYGASPRSLRTVTSFFVYTFPAALWHRRHFVAVSAALLVLPAVVMAVWLANSPRAVEAVAPPALREAYVNHDFEAYYSSGPATEFAAQVWTNNVQVGFLAFSAGILACVFTAVILVVNGANIGVVAGLFAHEGQNAKFYGLILPHGLLELTAVVIAGAAGLALGWAVIDPGDRTRRAAVGEEGRRSAVLALGLVLTFAVAGLIEAFVTGSTLPTWARVGLGIAVEVAFLVYVYVQGARAVALGFTGQFGERAAPAPAPGQSLPVALTSR